MDALLHSAAAAAMMMVATTGRFGVAAVIGLGWLLRELAQKNSGNIIAAVRSMPSWPLSKHMEWVAPTIAALLVCGLFK